MNTKTLEKLLMLCLKYPTAENIAIAKEVMQALKNDKVAE